MSLETSEQHLRINKEDDVSIRAIVILELCVDQYLIITFSSATSTITIFYTWPTCKS
jgi:hypothetical protein